MKEIKNIFSEKKIKNKNEDLSDINNSQKSISISNIKYEEKILQIKRVTKVVKGGKKMTFRAIVIVGDGIQKVGVGIGRADDVNLAIDKAILNGKKTLVTVPLTFKNSIPYIIRASYGACNILLKPANPGSGIIAGGSVKTVLELGGIKNISAKQFGSNNILNNAKATILALITLNKKVDLYKKQYKSKHLFYTKIMKISKDN